MGNVIKTGIPVAIIGETNAGKSTLLNVLLNEEKAIVTDIHGTTRDTIEDTINIGGILFRFIDTAGIRQTTDTLENIGIERTFKKIEQASIVLWVIDLTSPEENLRQTAETLIPKLNKNRSFCFSTKPTFSRPKNRIKTAIEPHLLPELKAERLFISAKTQQNIDQLRSLLVEMAHIPQIGENDVIVTNLRHYEALKRRWRPFAE